MKLQNVRDGQNLNSTIGPKPLGSPFLGTNVINFYKICLGDEKDAEKYDDFATYAQMLDMTISSKNPQKYVPKYFKMDIEVMSLIFFYLICRQLNEIGTRLCTRTCSQV